MQPDLWIAYAHCSLLCKWKSEHSWVKSFSAADFFRQRMLFNECKVVSRRMTIPLTFYCYLKYIYIKTIRSFFAIFWPFFSLSFFFPFPSLTRSSLGKDSKSQNGNLRVSHQPSEPKHFSVDGIFILNANTSFQIVLAWVFCLGDGGERGGLCFFSRKNNFYSPLE